MNRLQVDQRQKNQVKNREIPDKKWALAKISHSSMSEYSNLQSAQ